MTVRSFVLPVRSSLPTSFLSTGMVFLIAYSIIDRLQTIISYDHIYVIDNRNTAEFDAPDVLHVQNGIFWAIRKHSSITLEDIRRAREECVIGDKLEIS